MTEQQIDRCGDCHSCCKSFSDVGTSGVYEDPNLISALNITYEYDRCNQLNSDNRCIIYEKRPNTCRSFECLYVESDLPEKYLPENVGFVTNVRRNNSLGINLQITINRSKSRNINADSWIDENIKNIIFMKDTAEEMWDMPIDKIAVSCYNGDKVFKL
jgi:Fe-S-cluster containining protein